MRKRRIIIILAILVVMIIIITTSILIFVLYYNRKMSNKPSEQHVATPAMPIEPIEIDEELKDVTVRNNFYMVKNCIMKFYAYYSAIYNEDAFLIKDEETIASLQESRKQNVEAVYHILDDDYKSYKNINLDNLTTKLPRMNIKNIEITDMYVTQKDENVSIYFVYGYGINELSELSEFSMIVKVDMLNRTYNILLGDYLTEKYGNITIGENVEINYPNEIVNNTHNTFQYQAITDDTYITDVFNSLKNNMIYNVEEVYKDLDNTYKQKRFPTLEKFKEYANNKIKEISAMQLLKYQKTKYEDYTQYVCLADNDKYYIINETASMKYSFILDTYTIDLPEFLDKYESSDDKTKVALNIQKVKEAINEQDFEYVYDKLDSTFRQNNFPEYDQFKKYLTANLSEENSFEYKNIEQQGDLYVANITINNTKKMNIIMKLLDGTDFYMSFSMGK